jgi:tetratricopeptide (TPR) repeat protein
VLISLNIITVSGQKDPSLNPKYGPDSASRVACANDLSTFVEYMKVNLPEDALPAWRNVFENCPASSKNIYINGVKIFQDKIEKTKNSELQSAYFDTLMLIYDKRIQYFGEEGLVLGRKGKDMLRYKSQDYEKAYSTLKQSMELSGKDTDPGVSVGLIETGVLMYKAGKISEKEFLDGYISISEISEQQLKNGGKPELIEQLFTRINAVVLKTGIANCQEIESAFKDRVISNSAGTTMLSLISDLLIASGCENADFFGEVNEKLIALEPTSDRAYALAWFYIKKEKFEVAISNLKNAIEIETDAEKNAHYYYQMALICNTKMNLQQDAVGYALKAINLLPAWGEPYLVIASAYILGSKDCFEGAFERSCVYWVAVDKCIKAKSLDTKLEEKANSLISEYSRFFPNNEEVFFRSLQEGNNYTVGCWINENTTVRVRK